MQIVLLIPLFLFSSIVLPICAQEIYTENLDQSEYLQFVPDARDILTVKRIENGNEWYDHIVYRDRGGNIRFLYVSPNGEVLTQSEFQRIHPPQPAKPFAHIENELATRLLSLSDSETIEVWLFFASPNYIGRTGQRTSGYNGPEDRISPSEQERRANERRERWKKNEQITKEKYRGVIDHLDRNADLVGTSFHQQLNDTEIRDRLERLGQATFSLQKNEIQLLTKISSEFVTSLTLEKSRDYGICQRYSDLSCCPNCEKEK